MSKRPTPHSGAPALHAAGFRSGFGLAVAVAVAVASALASALVLTLTLALALTLALTLAPPLPYPYAYPYLAPTPNQVPRQARLPKVDGRKSRGLSGDSGALTLPTHLCLTTPVALYFRQAGGMARRAQWRDSSFSVLAKVVVLLPTVAAKENEAEKEGGKGGGVRERESERESERERERERERFYYRPF